MSKLTNPYFNCIFLIGGVFIATVIGLIIAMITLAVEVYMQKKNEKNQVEDELNATAKMDSKIKTIDIKPYKSDVDWFMKKTIESMSRHDEGY